MFLLLISHVVTAFYWGALLKNNTKVGFRILVFLTFFAKVLQCKADSRLWKKWLCKYLPFLPASLPTLLFCRLAELNVMLTGSQMLGPEAWEAFVQERIALAWMANDVKIIGEA